MDVIKDNGILIGTILVGLVLLVTVTLVADYTGDSYKEAINDIGKTANESKEEAERLEAEILRKGKDAEALVIDKKEVNNSTADQLMMTPFMVGNMTLTTASIIPGTTSSNYSLKLYVDEQNYNIAVPRDIFEKKSIGSKMRVKIFEDRLLSLE
ncbi:hypothetical protein ACH0BF_16260 [Pseudobacillus sp. 179-B 2D1 NHS]|uniref:hypothetical protein n=1 Tax=Pseudobacillus sp. 179-B 2D1 NHS TaxID=3374292 RepID=UPI003879C479